MGDFTRVKSPMNFHGGFYSSGNTLDYKMTHLLFTLFQIISNILTSSLLTFSVIYTFYFYIAFEELTFYQKWSIKCVLYSLFYKKNERTIDDYINRDKDQISEGMTLTHLMSKTKKSRWAIDEAKVERERRTREPIFEMFLFAIADTFQFLFCFESFQNIGVVAGRIHDYLNLIKANLTTTMISQSQPQPQP